jgi:hypothetical protein
MRLNINNNFFLLLALFLGFLLPLSSAMAQKNAADPMFIKKKVNKKSGAYEDKRFKKKPASVVIAQEFDDGQKDYTNPKKAARKAEKETKKIQNESAKKREKQNKKIRKGNTHADSFKKPKGKKASKKPKSKIEN